MEGSFSCVPTASPSLPDSKPAPTRARLLNIWGKELFSLELPKLSFVKPKGSDFEGRVESTLSCGLKIVRTQDTKDGALVTFSDGTELLCGLVVFADGSHSQARSFWRKLAKIQEDKFAIRRWSFNVPDWSSSSTWDFRWAPGKSVEFVPFEEKQLHVVLRFKSPFGGALNPAELKELFSEFGRDVTGLFDDLEEASILCEKESNIEDAVFSPAPGCVSIGEAAWAARPFLTFHWLNRFVEKQLEVLAEQLRLESYQPQSFEAQSCELLEELKSAESFFRKFLHEDHVLWRPLRALLVRILPNAVLSSRLRRRFYMF